MTNVFEFVSVFGAIVTGVYLLMNGKSENNKSVTFDESEPEIIPAEPDYESDESGESWNTQYYES